MKKVFEGVSLAQAVWTLIIGVASAAGAAFTAYNVATAKTEARIATLEKYVEDSGPTATFWERQCAKLIDQYATSSSLTQSLQIERAMDKIGCEKEPAAISSGT